MLSRRDMMERLVGVCPSFGARWEEGMRGDYVDVDGTPLDYVALGGLAGHLVDLAQAGRCDEFSAVFGEVELLLLHGNDELRQAMVVGFLEGIQNHASHTTLNPDSFLKWMGPESKHWWGRLNRFWQGLGWMPETAALILEDNEERVVRFTQVLRAISPELGIVYWRSAKKMMEEVGEYLPRARLISLDHDLEPMPGETADPGDGLEVAKFLAERRPGCPIIIHSSNGDGARRMAGELGLAGCAVKVIAPLGADWVEAYWGWAVRLMLGVEG